MDGMDSTMRIVADQAIPYLQETFGKLGDLEPLPAAAITRDSLHDADLLIVRTRTQVNATLLEGTKVQFVGTANVGTDHIDLDYLHARGIALANAPGSNANAVAEYILTALFRLASEKGFSALDKSLGIVGVGNVGGRLAQKAGILGMNVLQCDPPKARSTGKKHFLSLDETLKADVITFHVPLNLSGPDTTYHLLNLFALQRMKPDSILINSSRGPVVDSVALRERLFCSPFLWVLLDVWEGEPEIDQGLLNLVDLATPHVAGYSEEGKLNATWMVYEAACSFLAAKVEASMKETFLSPVDRAVEIPDSCCQLENALATVFRQVYDIRKDDSELRKIDGLNAADRRSYFDDLRNRYVFRREFSAYSVSLPIERTEWKNVFEALGFRVRLRSDSDLDPSTSALSRLTPEPNRSVDLPKH